jgi:hypothetical protein
LSSARNHGSGGAKFFSLICEPLSPDAPCRIAGECACPALTTLSERKDLERPDSHPFGNAEQASVEQVRCAFETVHASLLAENWFLDTVRAELAKRAPLSSFPTVTSTNGHDYLLHFTQFLFFLKALDCTDAAQIGNFIEEHNRKIQKDLGSSNFSRSANEYQKAIIRPERKAKILDTIRMLGRPVFAIYEYGHLLIDEMSPKTTEKLIEDLRHGGLLVRCVGDRLASEQKRVLIDSTGFLENTYVISLLMQRRLIAGSMDEDEYKRARQA